MPWLGEVPAHWELVPNRAIVSRRKVLVGEGHKKYRLLSLTKQGVVVRDMTNLHGKFSADMGTSQEVRPGDLVFCLFDVPETPRTVGLSTHHGMITGAYTVFESLGRCSERFFELFYIAMDDRKLLGPLYSGLRNTIPPPVFLGVKTPLPPPGEQAAIVRFLDHVNRRIWRYIRAKQKLIRLLDEQKQVIIHHAVTRGLDPNVRLKPSGAEWLGDVPEHWRVTSLKRIAWFKSGAGFPTTEQGKQGLDVPFLRVSDMTRSGNQKWIETCDSTVSRDTAKHLGATVFPAGTIIFPKVGGALLTNKRRLLRVPSCIDNNVMGCVVSGTNLDFAFELLQVLDLGKLAKPGPVPAIGEGDVREVKAAIPPESEQREIVRSICETTASLAVAVSSTQHEITLLHEFRTRLIADVVTGKLDVREAAAHLSEEVPDVEAADASETWAEETSESEEMDDAAIEEAEA